LLQCLRSSALSPVVFARSALRLPGVMNGVKNLEVAIMKRGEAISVIPDDELARMIKILEPH
jgi:hypothetical protein